MSTVNNGPQIVRSGLVLGLDASTRGSCLPNSLINMNNWTVSNGSVTGYNQNGADAENQRSAASNPWGQTGIIWGTFPDGTSGADGGWNTPDFNIDNTKLYRFSVWVKRTSSTSGGTFYFGMYAGGDGSRRMDNSAVEGNAYWSCIGTSGLVQNVWHLYVGHVYPFSTSYTGRHPDTGYYFVNNPTKQGDINGCNIGTGDLKWSSNSTTGIHRTYHYYCGDTTTRLQFYNPRVDLVDGKQPSINELVTRSPIEWKDLSGNNNNGTLSANGPTFSATNKGAIVFDGVDDYIDLNSNNIITGLNPFTFEAFYKLSGAGNAELFGNYGSGYSTNYIWISGRYGLFINGGYPYFQGYPLSTGTYHMAVTRDSAGTCSLYKNGVLDGTATNTVSIPVGLNFRIGSDVNGLSELLNGEIYSMRVYNRTLSATEIFNNYQATKTRFGL